MAKVPKPKFSTVILLLNYGYFLVITLGFFLGKVCIVFGHFVPIFWT